MIKLSSLFIKETLALSEAISDEMFVKILNEKSPKYGLTLGGFQGQYYSCNETGKLKFESSWNSVRANLQKALSRWGDKAYGILRGIINKGGRSEYFDLLAAKVGSQNAGKLVEPFRMIQNPRSYGVAHRKGKDYLKLITKYGLTGFSNQNKFIALLVKAKSSLGTLAMV